jgi:DNA-binding transcriptional LysR family regulator
MIPIHSRYNWQANDWLGPDRRCNSGFAVLDAAIQGLGICQLPDFYVQHHLHDGTLVELLADERPSDQAIWAIFPKRSPQPSKIAALIRFLQVNVSLTSETRHVDDHHAQR